MRTPVSELLVNDGRAFGVDHPMVASRLGGTAPEPITGRIGKGLLMLAEQALGVVEDLRAGLTERIAERASPWLLRPIPAATVVAFEPSGAAVIDVGARTLLRSRPIDGTACSFRTLRPVRVAPYVVRRAELNVPPGRPAVLLVEFEGTADLPLGTAFGESISLFVDGDRELALGLVHALTTQATRVSWQSPDWEAPLDVAPARTTRSGFGRDEALAPDSDGILQAFAAVTEAFVCPDKFRFVEFTNPLADRPPTSTATLVVQLGGQGDGRWESQPVTIRAHAVPAVNLFDASAEPVLLDPIARPQPLRIAGLSAASGGVYAVRDAHATDRSMLNPLRLPDRRRLGAEVAAPDAPATFATSIDRDDGSLLLHLSPRAEARPAPAGYAISVRVIACNRHLASRVRAGELSGRLAHSAGSLPYASVVATSRFIDRPTGLDFQLRAVLEAAVRRDADDPLQSLRRALALCVPSWGLPKEQVAALQARLDALHRLDFRVARRPASPRAVQVGYDYTLTLDESAFLGPGEIGLFGAALAEAMHRCIPVTTYVSLTVVGAKTGKATTYVKGMLA